MLCIVTRGVKAVFEAYYDGIFDGIYLFSK